MLRALKVARRSAVKAKTQQDVGGKPAPCPGVMSAPERLRADFRGLPVQRLAEKASRFRCQAQPADPTAATKFAYAAWLAAKQRLSEEIAERARRTDRTPRERSIS